MRETIIPPRKPVPWPKYKEEFDAWFETDIVPYLKEEYGPVRILKILAGEAWDKAIKVAKTKDNNG